jgi:hypothetical protein
MYELHVRHTLTSYTNVKTLFRRKELALHISSVRLHKNGQILPITNAKRTTPNNDVWAYASAILDTLQSVTAEASGFPRARYYILHWLNHLVQDYGQNFDSISALILCMATNLQRIDIDVGDWSRFRTTPEVLMMPWKGIDTHPFKKVTEFSVGGRFGTEYEVVLLPSVVALTVKGTGANVIPSRHLERFTLPNTGEPFLYPAPLPTPPSLRTLKFFGLTNINAELLAKMVSSPWLVNLKELFVERCGDRISHTHPKPMISPLFFAL